MRFVHDTAAVAHLYVVNLLEPVTRAAVIVKKTYALGEDGGLVAAGDPLPLVVDQLVTDYGHFHGELFFRKRGVDVCVLGTVRLDRAVTVAPLALSIGTFRHALRLFGDRVWRRNAAGATVASEPEPFCEMTVGYGRAFGGVAQVNGEDVPWPDNPIGRGYYETEEEALGKSLANLEPDAPSFSPQQWRPRVPVVGWGPYPNYWGLRASRAVKVDADSGELVDLSRELFNHAHPALVLDQVEREAPILVTGLRPKPLHFRLPRERPQVEVHVGASSFAVLGDLDGVFFWADAARVVLTWRARFFYPLRPEEVRRAVLSFVE